MTSEVSSSAQRAQVAYIGLGANLGDPIQQIVDARTMLSKLPSIHKLECSSMYVSSPVGYSDQPDFINCVVRIETSSAPHALFAAMQEIEQNLGRVRIDANQNAPRTIDLDLLIYGDQRISDEVLTVPHPRIGQRLFVLRPLLEFLSVAALTEKGVDISDEYPGQLLHRLKC